MTKKVKCFLSFILIFLYYIGHKAISTLIDNQVYTNQLNSSNEAYIKLELARLFEIWSLPILIIFLVFIFWPEIKNVLKNIYKGR